MSNKILNKERYYIMKKFTVNTNKAMNAEKYMNSASIKGGYFRENTPSINKAYDLLDNDSIFSLYLQENGASLFCSYGDVSAGIIEPEDICFLSEDEVIFFNISYKKGLHILKCLGYEKVSASFSPFDACIDDDNNTSTLAIYYQEDWKRIQ